MSPNFKIPDGLDLDVFDFAAPTFPSVSTKATPVPGTSSKRSTRRTTMLMPDLRQSLNEVTLLTFIANFVGKLHPQTSFNDQRGRLVTER